MPFFSVIVPVYNTARQLPACLDSLFGQPFADWELILVDNACTDGSAELCDARAAQDPRVRVIHALENAGPGPARNLGLDLACGDYVYFADSDDDLAPGQLDRLAAHLRRHGLPDVAYLPCVESFEPLGTFTGGSPCKAPADPGLAGDASRFLEAYALQDRTGFQVWMLALRRDFLVRHGLRFHAHRMGEDIDFTTRVLCLASTLSVFDAVFYHWRQSLSRSFIETYAPHGWAFLQAAASMLDFMGSHSLRAPATHLVRGYVQGYLEHFERRFLPGLRAPNKTLLYKQLQMQNIEGWSERFCHLSCGRRSSR